MQAKKKVVLRFQGAGVLPSLVQRQYGWAHEQPQPDGSLEMTFFSGTLEYLAVWLLPYASAVTVLEPLALREHLCELAQRAHYFFCAPGPAAGIGLS